MALSKHPNAYPRLEVGRLEREDAFGQWEVVCTIWLGQQTIIGRDFEKCDVHFFDPQISHRHLKIYSFTYDQSEPGLVQPLVYAEDLSRNGSDWNSWTMGKGEGAFLLCDNDELRLSPHLTLVFRTDIKYESWDRRDRNVPRTGEFKHFAKLYHISDRMLGAGADGRVYMAESYVSCRQVACKIVNVKGMRAEIAKQLEDADAQTTEATTVADDTTATIDAMACWVQKTLDLRMKRLRREVDVVKSLSHPNIVRLEKVFRSKDTVFLFQELLTGGDLFSYIDFKGGALDEAEGGLVILQVATAIKYLHDKDIIHRDIKPENILIASLTAGARVVLADFGQAISLPQEGKSTTQRTDSFVGTLEYSAPEIHSCNRLPEQSGYTKAVDMWSLGCVAAAALTGQTPFGWTSGDASDERRQSANVLDRLSKCAMGGLTESAKWQTMSANPKNFIQKLLVLDESERMTAAQALEHRWFTDERVKSAFQTAYRRAVSGWKERPAAGESLVEHIPVHLTQTQRAVSRRRSCPSRISADCTTTKSPEIPGDNHSGPKSSFPKTPKNCRPIEPHYRPTYRSIREIMSPERVDNSVEVAKACQQWGVPVEDEILYPNRLSPQESFLAAKAAIWEQAVFRDVADLGNRGAKSPTGPRRDPGAWMHVMPAVQAQAEGICEKPISKLATQDETSGNAIDKAPTEGLEEKQEVEDGGTARSAANTCHELLSTQVTTDATNERFNGVDLGTKDSCAQNNTCFTSIHRPQPVKLDFGTMTDNDNAGTGASAAIGGHDGALIRKTDQAYAQFRDARGKKRQAPEDQASRRNLPPPTKRRKLSVELDALRDHSSPLYRKSIAAQY